MAPADPQPPIPKKKPKILLCHDDSYVPQYHYNSSSSSSSEEEDLNMFKKTLKREEIRLDTDLRPLETERDLISTGRTGLSARSPPDPQPEKQLARLTTSDLAASLQKSKSCLFGLYLRYVCWPGFTLYRALVLIVLADAAAFLSAVVYAVPLFLDSGPVMTTRLCLDFVQIVVLVVLVKLETAMLYKHAYRQWSKAIYILRITSLLILGLQSAFWTEIGGKDYEGPNVLWINSMFQVLAPVGLIYQLSSIWVHLSVLYWSQVMLTKQRTLIIIKNLLPKPNQVTLKIVPNNSEGLACQRGHKASAYERNQR